LEQQIQISLEKIRYQANIGKSKASSDKRKSGTVFGEYNRHRSAFSSFEEFINWYNDRPHESLNFQRPETPEKAFRRKMPLEAYFAVGHGLFGL
jgi:putative transposase